MQPDQLVTLLQKNDIQIQEYEIRHKADLHHYDVVFAENTDWRENTLYFVQSAQNADFLKQISKEVPINLLVEDWETLPDPEDFPFLNLVILSAGQMDAAFRVVKKAFDSVYEMQFSLDSLLQNIASGKELSQIFDSLVEHTKNSVVAIDICGKVIEHSSYFYINDPMWLRSIQSGYCPTVFMKHIEDRRNEAFLSKREESAYTVVCEEMKIKYLCSNIMLGRERIGYCFMFNPDNEFRDEDYFSLPILSKVVCQHLLNLNSKLSIHNLAPRSLLQELIENADIEEPVRKIQDFHFQIPTMQRVICMASRYSQSANPLSQKAVTILIQTLEAELFTEYQNMSVFLCSSAIAEKLFEEPKEEAGRRLQKMIQEKDLLFGISKPYRDIKNFKEYFLQARSALRLGLHQRSMGPFIQYEEVAYFDLLSNLPADLPLERFVHPALRILERYDRKNGTELYRTLHLLLYCGLNVQETADRMYIHRNTIVYRKRQIEKIGHLDLSQSNTIFILRGSYCIDEFLRNEILKP